MKRCPRCDRLLPLEEFGTNRSNKDGLQHYCKACHRRSVSESKAKAGNRSEKHRAYKYKLTVQEVHEYAAIPCCQACGKVFETDHQQKFDHCHEGGHMRGVLCHKCNIAISGSADEALARMMACRDYLIRDMERQLEQARAS